MRRRSGITLIEVLVAIFIMTIGLLALLTLFPLGALNMSRALQDDRTASAAANAANLFDALSLRNDSAFDYITAPTSGFPNANPAGPGFPVFVDPYGAPGGLLAAASGGVLGASSLTTPATPGIPRVSPATIPAPFNTPSTMAPRYFTLLDDLGFLGNGAPDGTSGVLQRGDRYTWGYMLHQSPPSLPGKQAPGFQVDVKVVVYAGRPPQSGETTYPAVGNQNDTAVTVTWAGQPQPNIVRGSWILDTSYDALPRKRSVHGYFYRVVAVTATGPTTLNLELQTALSQQVSAVTVMDNVVEVFDRGNH